MVTEKSQAARSGVEEKLKPGACLIEAQKKLETRTEPELQRAEPLKRTANELEDSSCLDLSLEDFVVVYIRPGKEDLGNLLKRGKEKVSYIFRGIKPTTLKSKFERKLGGLKPLKYEEIRTDIFLYTYELSYKERVYDSARCLNKKL